MGRQDRDWARWTDDERRRLYGSDAPAPRGRTYPAGALWVVLATFAIATLTWAGVMQRPFRTAARTPASPTVVYGDPGSSFAGAATADPYAPGGARTVCTDETAVDGGWACNSFQLLLNGESTAVAAPSPVPCTAERVVDQTTGRWACADRATSLG